MMHRLVWTTCGLWLLMLLFFVHNDRCIAYDLQLHYKPEPQASGFINSSVTPSELAGTITFAEDLVDKMRRLESSISQSRIQLTKDSTSFALLLDSLPDERSKQQDRQAQIVLKASVQLLNNYCLGRGRHTEAECARDIATVPLPESTAALATCRASNDGGEPNTYRRLLPAIYNDGLHRMSHAHSQPLAKTISDSLFADAQSNAPKSRATVDVDVDVDVDAMRVGADQEGPANGVRNNAVVQWAQFVEHDLAKTVFRTMDNNVPIECCDDNFRDAAPRYRHPACAPLMVESKGNHISCLNYVRSALGVSANCKFGPAQQRNQATSQLDLSQLYGNGEPGASALRSHTGGELLSGGTQAAETLPEAPPLSEMCMTRNATGIDVTHTCYQSGDSRCNANPFVTPMYTLFLRSHNQLARAIRRRKPNWSDERIFKKARRINTVIYKRIVFAEWLPIVVGADLAAQIDATPSPQVGAIAAVSNEWATSAARFYYSMMPGGLRLNGEPWSGNEIAPATWLDLQHEFYRPRDLGHDRTLDRIMAAILEQKAMAMDTSYVDDVSQYLFRNSPDQEIGTDVLALDIQRGRDHGLAGYTQYVELCTGRPVTEWDQLRQTMSAVNVDRLRTIYRHLHQIDLIVGGIAETPQPGATVGPTFACLIGEQFASTQRNSHSTIDVGYTTLLGGRYSGVHFLCENTGLAFVPQNIFHVASDVNPLVDCSTLRKLCAMLNLC